jgi:CDP-diacylglycerol--glycerol-3-phosphate 3-phosphatidyltransferase
MPSIYQLKSRFQKLLSPVVEKLAAKGVTANQVTVASALLSCLFGSFIAMFPSQAWPLLLLPPFLFIRMALNAIDGMLARNYGMKSSLGAILNEIGDVVSDAALYLPFALVAPMQSILIVIAVVLSVISEMTGVVGVQIGASRRYDGPMGKSDRAFVFGLLALLIGLGFDTSAWLCWAIAAMNILLVWTIVNRARRALAEVKEKCPS